MEGERLRQRRLRRLLLGGMALWLAFHLSGCWSLFLPRLERVMEQAVEQTRQAVLPVGEDGQFQLLGVRWLEQEGGYLIAVDYAGKVDPGDRFSGTCYFHWRRWGNGMEQLETRSQQGLAEVQLSASLDSHLWTPEEGPQRLEEGFHLEKES